jgi:hypothetical protein
MQIYKRMTEIFGPAAERSRIELINIGLGYTAVKLTDGSLGLAYTYLDAKQGCSLVSDQTDYEGRSGAELLKKLYAENLVERSAGIALVNALNHRRSREFPEDGGTLLDDLGVTSGSTVAMAGYFDPVVALIEQRGATVRAHDIGKGIGERESFYRFLESGAPTALILTSTSVIGGTTEEVLSRIAPGTPCALLGPTTPMIPEVFTHLPVHFLGGTLPVETEGVLKAVRQGMGTRAIHKASRKIYYRAAADEIPPLREYGVTGGITQT